MVEGDDDIKGSVMNLSTFLIADLADAVANVLDENVCFPASSSLHLNVAFDGVVDLLLPRFVANRLLLSSIDKARNDLDKEEEFYECIIRKHPGSILTKVGIRTRIKRRR